MILADENIPFEITKSLREQGFEVTSIYETSRGISYETLERPFFATITAKKIRVRQL